MYTTMIAFDTDELSTIIGNGYLDEYRADERIKSFSFADLPCPPKSVMVWIHGQSGNNQS